MTKPDGCSAPAQFVDFVDEHACANKVQHWQLRDLVSFDATTHKVYTVDGPRIMQFDPKRKKSEVLATTHAVGRTSSTSNNSLSSVSTSSSNSRRNEGPPAATTLAVAGGFAATGTDKGEPFFQSYHRRRMHAADSPAFTRWQWWRDTGQPRLYASGNDKVVRCYRLAVDDFRLVDSLEFHAAVNYSAESPDGDTLVTLGDTDKITLHRRDSTGRFAHRTELQSSSADGSTACGMCCAWHPWGHCFATAFQCGEVAVWDVRSHKMVAKQESNRAVRNVKFTSEPADLLAYAEHEGTFHVVDARAWQARQTLRATGSHTGLSGMAFTPEAGRLYVGIDGKGLQEWAVDNVSRRGFSCCPPSR